MPDIDTPRESDPTDSLFGPGPRRSPIAWTLDLLASVRFGIVQMVALFIYCTIGSAGLIYPVLGPGHWNVFSAENWRHDMIRQWPAFELTEFEWFHTPLFNFMIALLSVSLIVTTFRRIRFNALTLGVWMIHLGIVMLCLGSFIYFGTKFEGDAPVRRCDVQIVVPGAPPTTLPAIPGSATAVSTSAGEYSFSIASIDPSWELRSEGDIGKRAYAVTLEVQTPTERFMRQLLAGYPQYTEDVIPGKGRVKKLPEFAGNALVDPTLELSLVPAVQDTFWIKDSAALVVRPVGANLWQQRVIHGLPRYNDRIESAADIWPSASANDEGARTRPIDLQVLPTEGAEDALSGINARITGFIRYGMMQAGLAPGASAPNPAAELSLTTPDGREFREMLLAFDELRRSAYDGRLSFEWIENKDQLPQFLSTGPRELTLRVPDQDIEQRIEFTLSDLDIPDRPMIPLGESGWQYRIREAKDRLPLTSGRSVTLLLVDLINPEGGRLTRWVFEDPARNRDNPETAAEDPHVPQQPDPRLVTAYKPGRTLSTISVVAGPGDVGLHVFHDDGAGARVQRTFAPREVVEILYGIKLRVSQIIPDAIEVEKPAVIPPRQRDRDSDAVQAYTLVRVELSKDGWREAKWIPFHRYTFDEPFEPVGVLSRYQPAVFTLPDGRALELAVGRERRRLPFEVRLDDFVLTSHVGGFTGRTSSVRDWTSILRFQQGAEWSAPTSISTNNPGQHDGLWFFQSYWDPPREARFAGDVPSQGLNFTGLGIGNRHGVYTQLAGCCISVAGMLYAFYIKPIIRRRRRLNVLSELEAGRLTRRAASPALEETPIRVGFALGAREKESRP